MKLNKATKQVIDVYLSLPTNKQKSNKNTQKKSRNVYG